MKMLVSSTMLTLVQGDITAQDTEAIVNAANSSLLGGGGVDGAIHRAGGPAILEECKAIRASCGELPPGDAIITGGGLLPARYVIHTTGPIWRGGNEHEEEILASAYLASLDLAIARSIKTIAFPSISTGAYGFPVRRAAAIAVRTVRRFVQGETGLKEVRFVAYSPSDFTIYASLFST